MKSFFLQISFCFHLLCFHVIVVDGFSFTARKYVHFYDFSKELVPYQTAYEWQEKLVDYHLERRILQKLPNEEQLVGSVILLQHPSVYTLGSGTTSDSGPFSNFDKNGNKLEYETMTVNRAGQATYHGPGQLVLYPVLDLDYFQNDLHVYLRNLEETVIHLCQQYYALDAYRIPGYTGVWIENHKISALGIKVRRWITMHGLSLNVDPSLTYFENIIPCGIKEKPVGILRQFRKDVKIHQTAVELVQSFEHIFQVRCQLQDHLTCSESN